MFLLIFGGHIGRLHTKPYKGALNVSANNSETVGHKDLRLGQIERDIERDKDRQM